MVKPNTNHFNLCHSSYIILKTQTEIIAYSILFFELKMYCIDYIIRQLRSYQSLFILVLYCKKKYLENDPFEKKLWQVPYTCSINLSVIKTQIFSQQTNCMCVDAYSDLQNKNYSNLSTIICTSNSNNSK